MHDRGYDAACIGLVNNFDRTNETGAKSVFWGGYRAQSVGSKAIDSFLSLTGPAKVGLDFAMDSVDFGADQCAISLKANQRIYFNNASTASGSMEAGWRTNVFNGDYMTSDGTIFKIVKGGVASLQVRSNNVLVNTSDGLIISSTGNITFNGTSQYGTGTSTATFTATNKPGSSTGVGPTQWIKVILGTSTFYLPAWAE
jgi:hypothetical protein